ncbi:MAG: hypothetical protein ACPIOQ_41410 [Promethearchaeia archaeon]
MCRMKIACAPFVSPQTDSKSVSPLFGERVKEWVKNDNALSTFRVEKEEAVSVSVRDLPP